MVGDDKTYLTVRDNVLLEYGYMAAALGRERVLICVDGNPKMPIDLGGLLYVKLERKFTAIGKIQGFLANIKPKQTS